MNERTYIVLYTLQSTSPSSAKYDAKHMFSYLDFRCHFEANGQNHIHFWLTQVLKNRMARDFLAFRSLSSKLEFVYPQWSCGVEEQMLILSLRLTPGRVKGSLNPIPKLAIVLIWKTSSCLKFGKTSNSAVQNLPQRKLWVWAANDACSKPRFWCHRTLASACFFGNDRSSHSRVRTQLLSKSVYYEWASDLHIHVPAITRGTLASPRELKNADLYE